jgi:tetratricopeptide (TPR) repeat protein
LGHLDKALQEFNETIRLNPWFPSVYNHRGLVNHALGNLDQALEDFDRAIQLDPKFADAYNNRALVLEADHPEKALEAWQIYLEVAKGFPDPQGRLLKAGERMKSLQKRLSLTRKPSPGPSHGIGTVLGKI